MSGIGERFRQRRFPAEFRIGPPAPAAPEPAPAPSVPSAPPEPDDLTDAALADIVTELWRTRRKIDDAGGEREVPRAQRQANRHLRTVWDRFTESGVTVEEFDGRRFDLGMDVSVLAYQDSPDAFEETVLETIRPSVYRGGRRIQTGQVLVAMPEKEQ